MGCLSASAEDVSELRDEQNRELTALVKHEWRRQRLFWKGRFKNDLPLEAMGILLYRGQRQLIESEWIEFTPIHTTR